MPKTGFLCLVGLILAISLSISSCGVSSSTTPVPATVSPTLVPTQTLSPAPTGEPTPSVSPEVVYLVKEGDNLSEIARIFGVQVERIVQRNNLTSPDLIFPGQVLIIPDAKEALSNFPETNKWILVVLSGQKVYAYEGDKLVKDFVVSTGVADFPTVTGIYYIKDKLDKDDMKGPNYDLKDVPWVMYFYEGYSFHGTYWHDNFGEPMSHGCINMKTEDAKWLYDWAPKNAKVEIRP